MHPKTNPCDSRRQRLCLPWQMTIGRIVASFTWLEVAGLQNMRLAAFRSSMSRLLADPGPEECLHTSSTSLPTNRLALFTSHSAAPFGIIVGRGKLRSPHYQTECGRCACRRRAELMRSSGCTYSSLQRVQRRQVMNPPPYAGLEGCIDGLLFSVLRLITLAVVVNRILNLSAAIDPSALLLRGPFVCARALRNNNLHRSVTGIKHTSFTTRATTSFVPS